MVAFARPIFSLYLLLVSGSVGELTKSIFCDSNQKKLWDPPKNTHSPLKNGGWESILNFWETLFSGPELSLVSSQEGRLSKAIPRGEKIETKSLPENSR